MLGLQPTVVVVSGGIPNTEYIFLIFQTPRKNKQILGKTIQWHFYNFFQCGKV